MAFNLASGPYMASGRSVVQALRRRERGVTPVALLRAIPDTLRLFHKFVKGEGDSRQTLDKEGTLVTVYDPVPYQASVNAGKELAALFNDPTTLRTHRRHQRPPTTIAARPLTSMVP